MACGTMAVRGAEASRRASSKSDREGMSRHSSAATLLPGAPSSTPATPNCLPAQPSVQREAAILKATRRTGHRSDFMHQFAGEEHNLVLTRDNFLMTAFADIAPIFPSRVVDEQFPAFERSGFA